MPLYSANSLVLRTYRYGEADRIVVFLTDDRGKKRGVAKNASASRRRFGAALDPLTCGRATYMEREHRELVRLDRIEPTAIPMMAAQGLEAGAAARTLGHASYFAELIDEWAPDDAPNERLFRLGAAVALTLARRPEAVDVVARYFEYWLLRLEGVYPAIDRCPRCGGGWRHGAALDSADRALVCGSCVAGRASVSPAAMIWLAELGRRTPDQAAEGVVPQDRVREIAQIHERLITWHLDKPLRSARVVKELGTDL